MHIDKYGNHCYFENDLCDALMQNPLLDLSGCLIDQPIRFDPQLELAVPSMSVYQAPDGSIEEFDTTNQSNWYMPEEYTRMDIAHWVISQCKTDKELERVGEELLMFADRNMFTLLQYVKYLVDIMRANNIVWGVGRGSSTASYVLFLIGIHRIDSIKYKLSIDEFLK